jgi:hypothetical protein
MPLYYDRFLVSIRSWISLEVRVHRLVSRRAQTLLARWVGYYCSRFSLPPHGRWGDEWDACLTLNLGRDEQIVPVKIVCTPTHQRQPPLPLSIMFSVRQAKVGTELLAFGTRSQRYEGVLFGTVRIIRRYRTVVMSKTSPCLFRQYFADVRFALSRHYKRNGFLSHFGSVMRTGHPWRNVN